MAIISTEQGLLLRFDSDIRFVDYAVDIVEDLMSYAGFGHRANLLIVTRELLKNAVVHGNRNDADKAGRAGRRVMRASTTSSACASSVRSRET